MSFHLTNAFISTCTLLDAVPWLFPNIWMFSDEIKSVYVRNLPLIVSASEIEEEFKKFGKLKPDAVAIRNRKVDSFSFPHVVSLQFWLRRKLTCDLCLIDVQEIGVCYAFVEFEDITGVQNAIKVWMYISILIVLYDMVLEFIHNKIMSSFKALYLFCFLTSCSNLPCANLFLIHL